MGNYSNKTVCVVDNGDFIETAITLAKEFGQVLYYYSPWQEGCAKSIRMFFGGGLEAECCKHNPEG